jgi:hypothetical protein
VTARRLPPKGGTGALVGCTWPGELWQMAGCEPPSPAIVCTLKEFYSIELDAAERELWSQLDATKRGLLKLAAKLFRRGEQREAWRVLVACFGRRSGKTTGLLAWVIAFESLCGGHDAYALAGSKIWAFVFAPSLRQAAESLRAVRRVFDELASLGVKYSLREAQDRAELTIEAPVARCEIGVAVMTWNAATARGFAVFCLCFDEPGHGKADEDNVNTDREVYAALLPATAQFPNAKVTFVSTPGPRGTLFEELVEKPGPGVLVARAPTWLVNPRITREKCLELAGGDSRVFATEYEASRFGALREHFVDEDAVQACVDPPVCSRGPRAGDFVLGVDLGLVHDASAIVVCSTFFVEPRPGVLPVRHVVVEHAEQHRGTRLQPLSMPGLLDRIASVSRAYGRALVRADMHYGIELERGLRERGVRVELVSMQPAAQHIRWQMVSQLVQGKRLHLPDHADLLKQLGGLRVTQLRSGAHKVEGKRDDLADALALGVEHAVSKLLPNGDGAIFAEREPIYFDNYTGAYGGAMAYYRRHPNGDVERVLPPKNTPEGQERIAELRAQGLSIPGYTDDEGDDTAFGVKVEH